MKTSEKVQLAGGVMFGLGMFLVGVVAASTQGLLNIPVLVDGPNLIGPDRFLPSTLGATLYFGGMLTWLSGLYIALLLGSLSQDIEEKLQY